MNTHLLPARVKLLGVLAVAVLVAAAFAARSTAAGDNAYTVHNIVSNIPGAADKTDPNLQNGWGLDAGPTSPWWVADNGTDKSTLYTAGGTILGLVVTVGGGPTGLVFNTGGATSFRVTNGVTTARALFLFASEDGTIRGWNPTVNATIAQVAFSSPDGASYKGLAIAALPTGDRLYAADFANAKVDMFNADFGLVSDETTFVDPMLPDGYAPFGIRVLGGTVFVTYARQDEEHEDEVAGQSLGFVDAYTTAGAFEGRVATRGQLNAPWGLAIAPDDFGRFSGDLLVGNFGDGQINAYEPLGNGHFEHRGTLRGEDGKPIVIDGLWALAFGHDSANNGSSKTLFFTAGPNDEADGLFGSITAG